MEETVSVTVRGTDTTRKEENTAYCSIDGILYDKSVSTLIVCPQGTPLTAVTIPDSVTSIGSSAFQGCTAITSVTMHEGIGQIGIYAFFKCGQLTEVRIPDGVSSIEMGTFRGCKSLSAVFIGVNVTHIGQFAFRDCENLTHVYYAGTSEQWDGIHLEDYWNLGAPCGVY